MGFRYDVCIMRDAEEKLPICWMAPEDYIFNTFIASHVCND